MKHYDITEWADYVRGLAVSRIASHGGAPVRGLPKLQHDRCAVREGRSRGQAEVRFEVPEFAAHCAKAIYVLQQPETVQILAGLRSKLVFDSFCEPLPAGVRSQHRISRQSLYEAGDYSLDIRQEHERGSSQVTLVGQIANRKDPERPVTAVPVYLLAGKSVVARAVSNQFGEFQMEYDARKRLRLYAPVENPRNSPGSPSQRKRSAKRSNKGGSGE